MTWPLLSNGLSEVGQLWTVSLSEAYTVDERRNSSCRARQVDEDADIVVALQCPWEAIHFKGICSARRGANRCRSKRSYHTWLRPCC
jgi:hypothetical protein